MTIRSWLRTLLARTPRTVREIAARSRPRLEALEDRLAPATYVVTHTSDDGSVGSLRWALAAANLVTPGTPDTIDIQTSGTINLTQGELPITDNLTINGPGTANLTINGQFASRVFSITSNSEVSISGLAIAGGLHVFGGGIFNAGRLTLDTVEIHHNGATVTGGGILNWGELTLKRVFLHDNIVIGSAGTPGDLGGSDGGPGQYVTGGGIATFGGSVTIDASAITNNLLHGGPGGNTGGDLFDVGNGGDGGGAFGSGLYAAPNLAGVGAVVRVTNSTIANNIAQGGSGGNGQSTARSEAGDGGNGGSVEGAGLHITGGSLRVTNSTIVANKAVGGVGGAAGVHTGTGFTIGADGQAGVSGGASGGGLHYEAPVTLNNTILSLNTGPELTGGASFALALNNCLLGVDPKLGPLGNHGGPTPTMVPLPGSPAINGGANSLAVDSLGQSLTTDQRGAGYRRTKGDRVEIGAVEVPTPILSPTLTSGKYGTLYSQTIEATEMDVTGESFTFAMSSGQLPPGLSLASDGTLSGTPTAAGTFSFTVTATDSSGYTGSQSYTIVIEKALLTITPDAGQSKVYFSDTPVLTYSASGFVNNDSPSVISGNLDTPTYYYSPVGTYAITIGSLTASNYTVTLAADAVLFAITPAALIVTANDQTKLVGEDNPEFTAHLNITEWFAADVGGSLAFTTSATKESPPGTYEVTPSGLTSPTGNYNITFVKGTLSVLSLVVTTTADVTDANDGVTSLREALANATLHPGPDRITFDPALFANGPATITLATATPGFGPTALAITSDVTITGPAGNGLAVGNGLTLSGAGANLRAFFVTATGSLTLENLTLRDFTITGEAGQYGQGGAVFNEGTLTLRSTTLMNNRATGDAGLGGAVINNHGSVVAVNSTLANNTAVGGIRGGFGGAIFSWNGSVDLLNCTLAGNAAAQGGGAVFLVGDGAVASAQLTNTLAADSVDGVTDFGSYTTNGGSILTSGSNNLIENNPVAGGFSGTGTISGQDPQLGTLGVNGGTTPTMSIAPTSPAYNAGTSDGAPTVDQRNSGRDSRPDIGAFENQVQITAQGLGAGISVRALTAPISQVQTAIFAGAFATAGASVFELNNTAVDLLAVPGSDMDLNTLGVFLTQLGRVTNSLGLTNTFPSVPVQQLITAQVGILAANIPGGLTGGNALVAPFQTALKQLITFNVPVLLGSLRTFLQTAFDPATGATAAQFQAIRSAVATLQATFRAGQPAAPSVELTVSPPSPVFGKDAPTLTATVTAASGTASPFGHVQFFNGTTPLGDPVRLVNGSASLRLWATALAVGSHSIAAVYNADQTDPNFTSTTVTADVTVAPASTMLTVATSTTNLMLGQRTVVIGSDGRFVASATLAGGNNATGTVKFELYAPSGAVVASQTVPVSGNGTYSTPVGYLPTQPGAYRWVVSYSGDANNRETQSSATVTAVGAGTTLVGDTLYLVGGNTNDRVEISPAGRSRTGSTGVEVEGSLAGVRFDGRVFHQAIGGIVVVGFNGNDRIEVEDGLTTNLTILLGDGNNRVRTGGGNDKITIWGNGNNTVMGGSGDDTIVIYGDGYNRIDGGLGDDILSVVGSGRWRQAGRRRGP